MKNSKNVPKYFKDYLKEVTKPYHDRIESTKIAKLMSSGEVDDQLYVDYLFMLKELHLTLEQKAQSFSEWKIWNIDINNRKRGRLLKLDIEALNLKPREYNQTISLEDWNFPKIVGAMYVLEGSTMGGQILSQRLSNIKGVDGKSATRYFEAYGEQTMSKWMEYSKFLNDFSTQNTTLNDDIIYGATKTYEAIENIMLKVKE